MFCYTIYYRHIKISSKEVSLITEDLRTFLSEKKALIEAIICNFEYIEEHDPFYDSEDQIGNNYFFRDTPQGILKKFNFTWNTPQELKNFHILWSMDINKLYSVLHTQKFIIVPKCSKKSWLYSHKYTGLKKYECNLLKR
jgi:hypothetical protein